MILLKDSVFQEILQFFDNCEMNGRDIPVVIEGILPARSGGAGRGSSTAAPGNAPTDAARNSVSYEARLFKSLFLRLYQ